MLANRDKFLIMSYLAARFRSIIAAKLVAEPFANRAFIPCNTKKSVVRCSFSMGCTSMVKLVFRLGRCQALVWLVSLYFW